MDRVCPACGAIGCKEKYGEILALEFEQPAVFGAVHHITVTCYNLQHPDAFSGEAIDWMRSSLRAIVEDGLSGQDMLKRARRSFKGGVSVKRHTSPAAAPSRTTWSMTVADVRTDGPDVYVEDIRAWAASIFNDLDVK